MTGGLVRKGKCSMKKLERILLILCIVLYSAMLIWNILHLSHVLADGKYYLHLYGLILSSFGALFS